MHRPKSLIVSGAAVAALLLSALPGVAAAVTVPIDQNTMITLRAPAGSVLIGNPTIVDVTIIDARRIAILGKTFGVTNLVVTDRMGRTIFEQQINVSGEGPGRVAVYRGGLVQNFACSPQCQRTPMPGEDKSGSYEPASGAYKDYSDRIRDASGAAPAQ